MKMSKNKDRNHIINNSCYCLQPFLYKLYFIFFQKIVKMDFQNECLHAHNEFRKKHGVLPLKLNREICRFSQEWANYLIKKNILQHSSNKDYGENLFCIQSSNPNFTINGREPVENWYEEIKCHTFGAEPRSLSSGHFTQVSKYQILVLFTQVYFANSVLFQVF